MEWRLHYGLRQRYDTRLHTFHYCARLTKPRSFQFVSVRSTASRKRCVLRVSAGRYELGLSKAYVKLDPRIYSKLIRDKNLSHGAFRLWHLLRDMTGNNPNCWPSQRYVKNALGCGINSVNRWTIELEEAGYLDCERGNQRVSNRYYLAVSITETPDVTNCNVTSQGRLCDSAVNVPSASTKESEFTPVEPTSITKNNDIFPDGPKTFKELREMLKRQ